MSRSNCELTFSPVLSVPFLLLFLLFVSSFPLLSVLVSRLPCRLPCAVFLFSCVQERVDVAGVKVVNFELTDISYAPEIAAAMLIRQQAEAMIDARKLIVEGAVDIACGAVEHLKKKGMDMKANDAAELVSNLLVVITGDSKAAPTVSVGANH